MFDPTTGDIVDYGTPVINNTVEMAIRVLPRQSQGPADLDGDGFIGNWDAAIFASYWDSQGPSPADLDGDGHVNMADYGILAGSDPAVGDFGEILLLQLAPGVDNMTAVSISGHSGQDGIVGNGGVLVDVVLPGETWVVVPEPATLLLLALGSFALKRRA